MKAMRQNARRRKTNLNALEAIKRSSKAVRKAVTAGKKDDLHKALSEAFASLDKAAKKHIIHKNTANRRKARLAAAVAKAAK